MDSNGSISPEHFSSSRLICPQGCSAQCNSEHRNISSNTRSRSARTRRGQYRVPEDLLRGMLTKVEDDGLTFLPDTIRADRIRDDGLRRELGTAGNIGKVRIALQIDVGLEDAIVPGPEELEYPTLLKFPAPRLHAYSKESVVAEKFEAMVKQYRQQPHERLLRSLGTGAEVRIRALPSARQSSNILRPGVQCCRHRRQWPCGPFSDLPAKRTQWQAFLRKSGLRGNSSPHKITLISFRCL